MVPHFTSPKDNKSWQSPMVLLILMVIAMQISHATWFALLNNFAINKVQFTGKEIGILQSLREIPGFLAFGAVLLLLYIKEQNLALLSLCFLGIGVALTGFFPTTYAFYLTTIIMSVGFHYYETIAQSLALQWLDKKEASYGLGKVLSASSFAALASFGMIYLTWTILKFPFEYVYLTAGTISLIIVAYCFLAFPKFPQKVPQHKKLIIRQRYWLYYALTFLSGARRQIFIVFAGFMMVEKFGYTVSAITTLFLVNHIFNMLLAPQIGKFIGYIGEKRALTIEYIGLIFVFTSYAFVEDANIAAFLYIIDHAFFALAIAIKTYFQKISDPADIAPTAGVAFSINHIAAVFLPVILGYIWLTNPSSVFLVGAAIAVMSLILSRFIPDKPNQTTEFSWKETVLSTEIK